MKNLIVIIIVLVANVCYGQKKTNSHFKPDSFFKPASSSTEDYTDTVKNSIFNPDAHDRTIYSHLNQKMYLNRADFDGAHFPVPAIFSGSSFEKDASFSQVAFDSFADFSGVTFKRDVNFSSTRLHYYLFISGLLTDSLTEFFFYHASLPALIDFSHNVVLHRSVDFTNSNFDSLSVKKTFWTDSRHFINLYNSDINKIKIDYGHFRMCFYDPQQGDKDLNDAIKGLGSSYKAKKINDKLAAYNELISLPTFKKYITEVFPSASMSDSVVSNFAKFYFGTPSFPSRLHGDQIDALYSRLLRNFEARGQVDSYEMLNADYQDYLWDNKWPWVSWLHVFPKYWNYYGSEKVWILAWTPGLLLVLTLATFFFYKKVFHKDSKNKVIYHLENIPEISSDDKTSRLIKLKNSFIFTCVIFFSFSLKTEKLDFKRPAFFYVIIINAFGLLCLAYLANFILQK